MRLQKPRHKFLLHYTPKQWVGFCNTGILVLVAFLCGLVLYEISVLDQRFISILDSSVVAIDLLQVNLINSQRTPYWKNVTSDISVYSAFYEIRRSEDNYIFIIGTSSRREINTQDLRCLIKYGEDEDINIVYVSHEKLPNCSTVLLYCHTKKDEIPKKVAVISYANDIPKQWTQVETIYSRSKIDPKQSKIAACVEPFSGHISAKQIAEFLAFYEIIGINHFYFYDYNSTQDSVEFIRLLMTTGHSIHVLPWNKKEAATGNCHAEWSEHVQDCLHRSMYKYSDVITIGVFDFFVPLQFTNLHEMIGDVRLTHGKSSRLQLKSANFCNAVDEYKDNYDEVSVTLRNMVLRGAIQSSDTSNIFRPDVESAILFNGSFRVGYGGMSVENLSEKYGIVHSYGNSCDSNATVDTSIFRYIGELDKSLVLQTYKRTLDVGDMQITLKITPTLNMLFT